MRARTRWSDGANILLGVWLFLSPWLLGVSDSTAAAWTAWILGLALLGISLFALARPTASFDEGIGVGLGVVLVLAPWVLGYSDLGRAVVNSLITGLIVIGLSTWGMTQARRLAQPHGAHT